MKKLFAFLLALMMVLSLAACGGGDDEKTPSSDDNPPSSTGQQEQNTPAPDPVEDEQPEETSDPDISEQADTSVDTLTVESFLELYGFTTDDITPNHFVSFDDVEMADSTKAGEKGSMGSITINVEKGKTTEDDYNAWFEKLYARMYELSEDGKLYYSVGNDVEAPTLEELQGEVLWPIMPGSNCLFTAEADGKTARLALAYSYDLEAEQYSISITVMSIS